MYMCCVKLYMYSTRKGKMRLSPSHKDFSLHFHFLSLKALFFSLSREARKAKNHPRFSHSMTHENIPLSQMK